MSAVAEKPIQSESTEQSAPSIDPQVTAMMAQAKSGKPYTPPTQLPIRDLTIRGRMPESFADVVSDHNQSVSALFRDTAGAKR